MRVVRHLPWVLGGFVVLILGWNAAQLGPSLSTHPALLPNPGVLAVVVAALLLNRSGRLAAAVGVVIVRTLGAATVPIWMVGLHGSVASVLMFVVPIVLAGLVLERRALSLATAWAVVALLTAAGMHAPGRLLAVADISIPKRSTLSWRFSTRIDRTFWVVVSVHEMTLAVPSQRLETKRLIRQIIKVPVPERCVRTAQDVASMQPVGNLRATRVSPCASNRSASRRSAS